MPWLMLLQKTYCIYGQIKAADVLKLLKLVPLFIVFFEVLKLP